MIPVRVNGAIYYKSSLSMKSYKCVGVRRAGKAIELINTKTAGPAIGFTIDEWRIFVQSVKAGEFDCMLDEQ